MIGLFSRTIALPLFATMVVALFTAHLDGVQQAFPTFNPMSWQMEHLVSQTPFHYMVMLLFVMILGPGKISLDALLKALRERLF